MYAIPSKVINLKRNVRLTKGTRIKIHQADGNTKCFKYRDPCESMCICSFDNAYILLSIWTWTFTYHLMYVYGHLFEYGIYIHNGSLQSFLFERNLYHLWCCLTIYGKLCELAFLAHSLPYLIVYDFNWNTLFVYLYVPIWLAPM